MIEQSVADRCPNIIKKEAEEYVRFSTNQMKNGAQKAVEAIIDSKSCLGNLDSWSARWFWT